MNFLLNASSLIIGFVLGTLWLYVIFRILSAVFYMPRRIDELEKRVKQLESKETV